MQTCRRVLFMVYVLCGFLLATHAYAAVHTEEVSYEAGDQKCKGYLAYDDASADKRPGILVVHEWWGHNDYARQRARMLAEAGYVAFALDMYGDGKRAAHPDDAGKMVAQVTKNLPVARRRFEAARDVLKTYSVCDANRMGAIGYCFGGGVVLQMARWGLDLKGVVSFHGSVVPMVIAKPGSVVADILVCNGAADSFVTVQHKEDFEKEMMTAKAHYRWIDYPGAKHSFTNPEATEIGKKFQLPLEYHAEADRQSWQDMLDFFKTVFAKS